VKKYVYRNPEYFSDIPDIDYSKYNGKLILYGAGKIGGIAAHALKKRGVDFVCFVDQMKEKQGTTFFGHPVISPEEMYEKYKDAPVMVSCIHARSLNTLFLEDGFTNIISAVPLLLEFDYDDYTGSETFGFVSRFVTQFLNVQHVGRKENIVSIFLNITSRCTLKCKECSAYIPYLSGYEDLDKNTVFKMISYLSASFNKIKNLNVQGGEPLLHRDLAAILRQALSFDNIEQVSIVTNGTLMPDPEVIEIAKDPRVLMRISNYGKLSVNLLRLITLCEKNDIRYEDTNYSYWHQVTLPERFHETDEQLRTKVLNCVIELATFGKYVATCQFALHMIRLGALPEFENSFLNIDNYKSEEDFARAVQQYLSSKESGQWFETCRYCYGPHTLSPAIPVAEQAKERLYFEKIDFPQSSDILAQ
jgi:organic radical activating enzyme